MTRKLEEMRMLVVEESAPAMRLLKMELNDLGVHQIFSATDGQEAKEFLDEAGEHIDMIICDWRMPRMTGYELLQEIRPDYPDLAFIMVTANGDVDSVKAALDSGVNAYVTKPYSVEQLQRRIEALAVQL